ncbi:hypothetical protein ACFMQL_39220 [Nonomuraea fastidiosa]
MRLLTQLVAVAAASFVGSAIAGAAPGTALRTPILGVGLPIGLTPAYLW